MDEDSCDKSFIRSFPLFVWLDSKETINLHTSFKDYW